MKTVIEVIQSGALFLEERGVGRPRRLVEDLVSHVSGLKRIDLYLQHDRPLEEKELTSLREMLKRCAKGEPLEYVLGEVDFYGCRIQIDKRALIPRPETEILVDLIVKKNTNKEKLKAIWDVCCGSGCIGIALKKMFPQAKVALSDLSADALSLARSNAERNEADVSFFHGDLLAPFSGQTADLIVSNPPYVTTNEYFSLDPSVRDFEPRQALVGGASGLEFYERLNEQIAPFLNPGGALWLEIGQGQGEVVKNIFIKGPWKVMEIIQDWSGKDRFFFLEKQ